MALALPDDILVPKKSPLGMAVRNLQFLHSSALQYNTSIGGLKPLMESQAYQILVDRNHNNHRLLFALIWVDYSKRKIREHEQATAIAVEAAAVALRSTNETLSATPASDLDTALINKIAAPPVLPDSGIAPPVPATKKEVYDKENPFAVRRFDPNDYTAVTVQQLLEIIAFQEMDWKHLPKDQAKAIPEIHLPSETLEKGLGVVLDHAPKGPARHVTIGRLQRALRHQWILSPGSHTERQDQMLVRIGSPFDVNVLTWRCTAGTCKYKVPMDSIMVPNTESFESLNELSVYEEISARWANETLTNGIKTVKEIRDETHDDII